MTINASFLDWIVRIHQNWQVQPNFKNTMGSHYGFNILIHLVWHFHQKLDPILSALKIQNKIHLPHMKAGPIAFPKSEEKQWGPPGDFELGLLQNSLFTFWIKFEFFTHFQTRKWIWELSMLTLVSYKFSKAMYPTIN